MRKINAPQGRSSERRSGYMTAIANFLYQGRRETGCPPMYEGSPKNVHCGPVRLTEIRYLVPVSRYTPVERQRLDAGVDASDMNVFVHLLSTRLKPWFPDVSRSLSSWQS